MKIGVVGYGSIGKRHAANARVLGHEVKGYDPLVIVKRDFKFERELYDWCDAAVIATPSNIHEAGLRACVERGKHVLVEKPISVGLGQLETLLRIADEKKLVVMMGNNLRFHPVTEALEAAVGRWRDDDVDVLWANFICATTTDKSAYLSDGVILCTGSHEVDLALHLFGPATVVIACTSHDVTADFVLQHEGGVRSSFHLDFETQREIRQITIGCRQASLVVDLPGRTMKSFDCNGMDYMTKFRGSYDDDYREEMQNFISRIEKPNGWVDGATGKDGLAVLKVLLDVRKMAGLQ